METRETFRSIPSRPIAFAIAALAVIALALTAWYVLDSRPLGGATPARHIVVTTGRPALSCGDPYSPHDSICAPSADPYSPRDPLN
jgi:hypothetical protein